ERGRASGLRVGHGLAGGEADALVWGEVAVMLEVVPLEAGLAIHRLARADEAQPGIAEAHPVVTMPAVQHGGVDADGDGADGRARPDPPRWRIPHPCLPVRLAHVFRLHAAETIRQVVVLRARHRMRQAIEAQLGQAGQELLEMLAPEEPEYELRRHGLAPARDEGEDAAGEERLVEQGHRAVSRGRGRRAAHRDRRCSGRMGSAVTATPSGATASATALAMAAGAPMVPPSPMPLYPPGVSGEGVSRWPMSND